MLNQSPLTQALEPVIKSGLSTKAKIAVAKQEDIEAFEKARDEFIAAYKSIDARKTDAWARCKSLRHLSEAMLEIESAQESREANLTYLRELADAERWADSEVA